MTPERWQRIERLYHAALELNGDQRRVMLDQACGTDDELRREVLTLIDDDADAQHFLSDPAVAQTARALAAETASLAAGRCIGAYEIVGPLGSGGMGEVYRARDTALGRDVAIKILPTAFLTRPDRLARFEREARLLATLNHPNIGTIYGIERQGGVPTLILELVEGTSLDALIAVGPRRSTGSSAGSGSRPVARTRPLAIPQILDLARQMVDALDAAHERGIVHRDLKPANVMVTAAGGVKVLDFGLAKATSGDGDAGLLPTITSDHTGEGAVLGTAAYMSPEQARGQAVDKRGDIWAFGCVLYEMLTGQRAFPGETTSDTIAAILDREPDWSALPAATPPRVVSLLHRCLEKDPKRRLRDIADARLDSADAEGPVALPAPRLRWIPWAIAAVLAAALVTIAVLTVRPAANDASGLVEFALDPPPDWGFPARWRADFAVSPDGRQIVFSATTNAKQVLWLRETNNRSARQLAGTEGGTGPFWSADGRHVGFFTASDIKRVQVAGASHPVTTVARVGRQGWATWGPDGTILFSFEFGAISRVASDGGEPTPVTSLAPGEEGHLWPVFLPDGKHFLFVAHAAGSGSRGQLRIGSVDSTSTEVLGTAESQTLYADGRLLFVVDHELTIRPFDPTRRRFVGPPTSAGVQVLHLPGGGRAAFSVSPAGVLAYRPAGQVQSSRLVWKNRAGDSLETIGEPPASYTNLGFDQATRRVVVSKFSPQGISEIFLIDPARPSAETQLTSGPNQKFDPALSPGGGQLAFNANPGNGPFRIFTRPVDSTAAAERADLPDAGGGAPDWSPRADFLAVSQGTQPAVNHIWIVPRGSGRKPYPFFERTESNEGGPSFSPDGRWLAYASTFSGRWEVWLRRFPQGDRETQVSIKGGRIPRWSPDGNELFYLSLDGWLMASEIVVGPDGRPTAKPATPLFQTGFTDSTGGHPYAVADHGQRFLLLVPEPASLDQSIVVDVNWRPGVHQDDRSSR